jgi:hypothetical protein
LSVLHDNGDLYASVTSSADGEFSIDAPGGQNIFVEVSGTNLISASFTGVAGIGVVQEVEDGRLFGFSELEYQNWTALFEGCPGIEESQAAVVGEIRLFGFADPETGLEPLITTGYAWVQDSNGDNYQACYLDDEGTAYDPEAVATGSSGRYAIFGAPVGLSQLTIGYEVAPGTVEDYEYFLWLPQGGVSPRFPSYVELAL